MNSFRLDTFLSGHVFAFVLIFARIGSAMMLMPGFSEAFVPVRVRLQLALLICFLLLEPLFPRLPAPPDSLADMTKLLVYEITIGLFFGTFLRTMISALESAGMVIGIQSGLSNATVLNPALASQSSLPAAFLSTMGIVLVFVTDLHRLIFQALIALYDAFPPGGEIMPGDMVQTIAHAVNDTFMVGIELAMPFLVIGLLMYIAVGLMQKLMPTIQLFMVLLPVQVWGGLALMGMTISGILAGWLRYFDTSIAAFGGR